MHILQTTLNKFISLNNKEKFLSLKKLSKHFKIRKDDISDIFSELEWIEHSNGYIIITEKGEEHCAPKHLSEEIKSTSEILWKETILKDEAFVDEVDTLINSFTVTKIS
ncbi:MAG: hypothetical protein L3J43_07450 [Sulfurovum sp.]|nr:hypothetical protein [Sulfurovum sp.]